MVKNRWHHLNIRKKTNRSPVIHIRTLITKVRSFKITPSSLSFRKKIISNIKGLCKRIYAIKLISLIKKTKKIRCYPKFKYYYFQKQTIYAINFIQNKITRFSSKRSRVLISRIIALVLIIIFLVEITPFGQRINSPYQTTQTQAKEIDFTESTLAPYLFEHRKNDFSAYFGNKKESAKHLFAFVHQNRKIEIALKNTVSFPQEEKQSNIPSAPTPPEDANTNQNIQSPFHASISAELEKIEKGLSTSSAEIRKIEERIKEVEKDISKIGQEVAKAVQGTTVTYVDAQEVVKTTEAAPNIDILYSALSDGIKEQIVLKTPYVKNRQQDSLSFSLSLSGVYYVKPPDENIWVFLDENTNQELFYFEKPFAYDSKGVKTDNVRLSISTAPTTDRRLPTADYLLTLSVDPDWLSSPERVYPVVIDPTVRLYNRQRIRSSSQNQASPSARIKDGQVKGASDFQPIDIEFRNIEANPKSTHRYQAILPGTRGRVLLSDKENRSVGYKVISGYQDNFWLELKMHDPEKEVSVIQATSSSNIQNTKDILDIKYKIPDTRVLRDRFPAITAGRFGQNKAVFQPKNFLRAEFEVLEDRVKANYILNSPPPESMLIQDPNSSTASAEILDTKYKIQDTKEYSLPFSLTYPWGVIIPQANESDGSLSFYKDAYGDGKEINGPELLKVLAPIASDSQGKTVPAFLEFAPPPLHPPLADTDSDGFPETITLKLVFQLDGTESYPITIDPVVVDSSAYSTATAYGNQRHIIRDNQGNGNLIAYEILSSLAICGDTSCGRVHISTNNGQTWNIMTTTTSANNSTISQDKSGNLHFASEWDSDILYRKFTVTRTNGDITSISSGGSPVTLDGTDSIDKSKRPSIIVDAGNDLPAISWHCEGLGGDKRTKFRYGRAKADPTSLANWCNAAGSSCGTAGTNCTDGTGGSSDEIMSQSANGFGQSVLVQMPGDIEPLTNQAGNLYVYMQDTVSGDLTVGKAAIATGGTPNFKWGTWSTATEQASDLSTTNNRYQDLTAARDLRNKRIVFAWTTDANTGKTFTPVTQIRYRSASDDATTDISPSTVFSDPGTGTDIGDEFQLTTDPVRNEYLLFYANSGNNIEYRKIGNHASYGTFGWKNESVATTQNFQSVDIFSSSLAFAVGNGGDLWKWNGVSWSNEDPATSNIFYSVDIFSSTLAFAVAGAGDLWKWNGVSWSNEDPATPNAFWSVDIFSSSLAFAVGSLGDLWKWNGVSWSNEDPATAKTFQSVDIFSSSLAFAVGNDGDLWKWNGVSWSNEDPATANTFQSVDIFSSTLAFAVGFTGDLWKWNGVSWSNEDPATTQTFNSVDIFSSSLAFAVGGIGDLWKWNGTGWSNEDPATTESFQSVDIFSSTLAFAVGQNGDLWKWNGTGWSNEDPATIQTFYSIDIFSSTLAFAVGSGGDIFKWTGGTIPHPVDTGTTNTYPAVPEWKYAGDQQPFNMLQTTTGTVTVEAERLYPDLSDAGSPLPIIASADDAEHLDDSSASPTDSQSITGTTVKLGRNNTNTENYHPGFRFQGVNVPQGSTVSSAYLDINASARTGTSSIPFTIYAEDADGAGGPSAYVVGDTGRIYRWNGTSWSNEKPAAESGNINWVDIYSTSLAFAVGGTASSDSLLYKWNGVNWSEETPPGETNRLIQVDIFSTSLAFAVGVSGRIYRWNGTSWINETISGASWNFNRVDVYSNTLAFAAGTAGNLYKWNGTSWANDKPSTTDSSDVFYRIDIYSSSLAWAVGGTSDTRTTAYRWNGTSWTNDPPGGGETNIMFVVDIYSSTLAYMVGGNNPNGRIYKWNGTSWSNETPAGLNLGLGALMIYSSTLAKAAGRSGTIFTWNGTSWTNESLSGISLHINDIDIYSPLLAYVLGDSALLYKWNGTSWSNDALPGETNHLKTMDILNAGDNLAFDTTNIYQFVGNRTRTGRYRSYSVNFTNTTYRFDVTDLVQEVVCRGASESLPCLGDYADTSGNWQAGNALTLLLISTDTSAADNYVSINAQDGTNALEPTLEINLADTSGVNYSRGPLTAAASTSDPPNNLAVSFSEQNYTDVGSNDSIYSDITNIASSSATRVDTPAFYFKKHNTNNSDLIDTTWDGQSSIAPSSNTVTFQVYNNNTNQWENEASNSSANADTDFSLSGNISASTSDYYASQYYDRKWTNETPATTQTFISVDIFSSSLAFAVGSNGDIWKWNGTSWSNEDPATGNAFESVDIFSSSLAFAVGQGGGLWKWNGTSWSNEDPATTQPFWSVDIFSSTLAFAVGQGGGLWKWNGTSWSNEDPATTYTFWSVDIFSSSLAFAVGSLGDLWKWNGTSWSNEDPATGQQFYSVDIFSSSLAFAAGNTGDLWKWNGVSWSNEDPATADAFQSIDIFSSTLAFAAGNNGNLWKWNGTGWSNETPSNVDTLDDFREVDIYSTSLAFAVGGTTTTRSSVYRWNGSTWSYDTPPAENKGFESVDIFSDALTFAVGYTGRIWKYSASSSQYWTYWRVYQDANDGQGALGNPQILRTDLITFSFVSPTPTTAPTSTPTPTPSGPSTSDQMRHGNWFSNFIEQYFTF